MSTQSRPIPELDRIDRTVLPYRPEKARLSIVALPKPKRKSPAGTPTNDLVLSAYQSSNDEVFPHVLRLYVAPGSSVADTTYGKGVFWKRVRISSYRLLATDLQGGTDARNLPYDEESIDCVVFDPPYMHTPGGSTHVGHQNYEDYYRNNQTNGTGKKYHEAVLDLYFTAAAEAYRVLRDEGIYIVKCQDEVCANKQRLTHVEIINELAASGFVVEDIFIVLRTNRPGVSRVVRQLHARKNHSYFLVFRKSGGKTRWTGTPIPKEEVSSIKRFVGAKAT
ncbi:MAG TPA: DNA methyltransferase [Acidobacteriaceae bacterium]